MIKFRDRGARGHHRGAWVDARHSFSFGDYMDPKHMGFRSLRVLNEDRIVPGAGFPEHAHSDMEILTFVLEGVIEHRDSLGNVARIVAGDVQRMSAGTGVSHSEMNASAQAKAHVLQVWIIPESRDLAPSYAQKGFAGAERNQAVLVASHDGRDGSLIVHQDAKVLLLRLDEGRSVDHAIAPGRGAWVQIVRGIAALDDTEMREGDGAAVEDVEGFTITAETETEVLIFDLA